MLDLPVVLIHGLSETRAAWRWQLPALAAVFGTITYDVRGFGISPVGRADGTLAQLADDLAQVLSAFGATSSHIIGFSMGGVIAQRFALDYPEAVDHLALIASSSTVGSAGARFFDERIAIASSGDVEKLASVNASDARDCFRLGNEMMQDEYEHLRTSAVTSLAGYANACRAMRRLYDEPLTPCLSGLPHRTLVVTGKEDRYCPPKAAEMIAEAVPDSELVIVDGAGHCVHWEMEAVLNETLVRFLTSG